MKKILSNKMLYIIAFICIILDQIIKLLIENSVNLFEKVDVIDNFFSITNVQNDGGAFSILSGYSLIFIILPIIFIMFIDKYYIKYNFSRFNKVIYGMLYGGVLANLVDRIVRGYVVDYFDFKIFNYNFPTFNLADSLIVISIFLIAIDIIRGEENANSGK